MPVARATMLIGPRAMICRRIRQLAQLACAASHTIGRRAVNGCTDMAGACTNQVRRIEQPSLVALTERRTSQKLCAGVGHCWPRHSLSQAYRHAPPRHSNINSVLDSCDGSVRTCGVADYCSQSKRGNCWNACRSPSLQRFCVSVSSASPAPRLSRWIGSKRSRA